MKSNVLGCVSAALLGAAIALPTPALARGGFGGSHFGGFGGHFGGFAPRFTGRSVAIGRFNRDNRFFFRHRRFGNFAFFGAPFFGFGAWPYYYGYAAYGGCWRQVLTGYGYQWANVCNDYGYNNGY
jgi:hypothetical protein